MSDKPQDTYERERGRKFGRNDLVRVLKEHAQKQGNSLPDMRKIERQAEQIASRNDRKKDG